MEQAKGQYLRLPRQGSTKIKTWGLFRQHTTAVISGLTQAAADAMCDARMMMTMRDLKEGEKNCFFLYLMMFVNEL